MFKKAETEYELMVAVKFYYDMYDFSGHPDWLEAAHDAELDLIMLEF